MMTREEKEKTYKKGKAAGVALAGSGVVAGGVGLLAGKHKGLQEYASKQGLDIAKTGRKLKLAGAITTAAGTGLAGVSAYKHYKHRKEDESSKK